MRKIGYIICCFCLSLQPSLWAQEKGSDEEQKDQETLLEETSFSGLKFRCVGPSLTSGRISDFAMHPDNPKIYYVATSSGGVWKTVNAGTTYEPIFDSEGSYSIGCVTLDPNNPNVVWVGSGENNNQRSVAYGDGVYRSDDGGAHWQHIGLKLSEHIGKVIVHPDNSDRIYVAAIGPLWKKGGERGVYQSNDGGDTWQLILELDEHTGVNDLVMDPRNPDVLYATAYQRRRHVFTYLGGGPGSAIYRSVDGGETWDKSSQGLPSVDLGRIGLCISPANPEFIYAIVEAAQGKGGLYRSTDRGASWSKRGGYSTSGNYYQEIVADPKNPDKLYAMDTWMKVSLDGGKTFKNVGEDYKHVDNHCMWIDPTDTDHYLVGCDGGIYETWDAAKNWHFKANLPITQFYKVAVDNAEPFYHIYGGTQDNFSIGGPSRTISGNGIANDEWFITHGGDGFESQVDPDNPNIIYSQSQYGVLVRYDKASGEELGIQPQPREDEAAYRWNWDAPLEVSNHQAGRLYFAANKVFQSDDRGHSWQVISDDLTAQINRNELEIMDRVWGIDAIAKNGSTSPYGTIVAFSESPVQEDLLFIGTDDGLIQMTDDGGDTWSRIEVAGAPDRSYVNEVLASHHSADVVYAAFNHHKYGDFQPYLFKSTNGGEHWTSISNNLPERGSIYALEEDHLDPDLLFVGTEFGLFVSNDGGSVWKQLEAGLPTIAIRDIAIQERENDLVLGTFGRGFYVLDDYSALRNLREADLEEEAALLAVRDASSWEWSYPYGLPGKSFQGDSYYQGDNLGPVALITYYLKEKITTKKEDRQKAEKELRKELQDVSYPSYDQLVEESIEEKPMIHFVIKDAQGEIVRKMSATPAAGVQRITWDLRYAPKGPVDLNKSSFYNPFAGVKEGHRVAPGDYTVAMHRWEQGEMTALGAPVAFKVKALQNLTLPAENVQALESFKKEVARLHSAVQGTGRLLSSLDGEMKHIRQAITYTEVDEHDFLPRVLEIEAEMRDLRKILYGDATARRLDMDAAPSVSGRVGNIVYQSKYSSSRPTQTHRDGVDIAKRAFAQILANVNQLLTDKVQPLREELVKSGAPYTPNALPEIIKY